eukprot:3246077-Pleurochrysis_carterae.AAC.1
MKLKSTGDFQCAAAAGRRCRAPRPAGAAPGPAAPPPATSTTLYTGQRLSTPFAPLFRYHFGQPAVQQVTLPKHPIFAQGSEHLLASKSQGARTKGIRIRFPHNCLNTVRTKDAPSSRRVLLLFSGPFSRPDSISSLRCAPV